MGKSYEKFLFMQASRVIDQIRGCVLLKTFVIPGLMPSRASYPILKLVYPVSTNASDNKDLNEADSMVSFLYSCLN